MLAREITFPVTILDTNSTNVACLDFKLVDAARADNPEMEEIPILRPIFDYISNFFSIIDEFFVRFFSTLLGGKSLTFSFGKLR